MGKQKASTVVEALTTIPSPISIRTNPFKCINTPAQATGQVPWCRQGYMLEGRRPNFTFDPLFHSGYYYVQESSSMFIAEVLRQTVNKPVRMLDLCAAPGGKSTCAMSALPVGSILFSNEPVRQRAQVLNENMLKFGHPDVWVTNNLASDFAKQKATFDVILTDVPCSGEGMMRKEPVAVSQWTPRLVEQCAELQRSIVADIWPCLRPGGLLIYSTCTFNRHEDEDNVEWIVHELGASFVEIATESTWGISGSMTGSMPVYRFLPGFTPGEGLFMAVLRKDGTSEEWDGNKNKIKTSALKVMSHGIAPDLSKGKKLIPDISKALSAVETGINKVDIDYETAIKYLRHEAITLPEGTPKGYVAVTFCGATLGFVNNLGNRANNLYPQEWRIKSTHVPDYTAIIGQAKAPDNEAILREFKNYINKKA